MKLAIAQQTASGVLDLYDADADPEQLATAVATGNAREYALSDAALAVALGTLPLGLLAPDDDVECLTGAVHTILDDDTQDSATQLDRLATAEPLNAAQDSWSEGLRAHDVGWTRALGPDACPICQGLADDIDGVMPASVEMVTPHPSCSCTAAPAQ
jgi:hypothetical protein